MKRTFYLILVFFFILDSIVPFVPVLALIELIYLLIPILITYISALVYLTLRFLTKTETKKSFYFFLTINIFIISQAVAVFVVHKVQQFRSEQIIIYLNEIKKKTGNYPNEDFSSFGIAYYKMSDNNHFGLKYSRGFLVNEKYNSGTKKWGSYR